MIIFSPKREEATEGRENYTMRSLLICTTHQIYWSEEIKKNEMGGSCSIFDGELHSWF